MPTKPFRNWTDPDSVDDGFGWNLLAVVEMTAAAAAAADVVVAVAAAGPHPDEDRHHGDHTDPEAMTGATIGPPGVETTGS